MNRGFQHSTPLIIDRLDASGTAHELERLPLTRREAISPGHDERWLQELLYRFPQLLPVSEIDPGLGALVPVCMELKTPAGYVDNLYITETGNLALAECKLWRNPEARREVVAQIIDYAHSMADWTYEELETAICESAGADSSKIDGRLVSLFREDSELDEPTFIDAVSRNLRLGRMLLLIVGDGIRQGVETLTEYLQMHAGFHFQLGIVEMQIFELPTSGFLVQPRLLARTVNIERGIVRLADGYLRVEPPERTSTKATSAQRTSISEDQLREQLKETAPQVRDALDSFLKEAEPLGVFVEPAPKSLMLRWLGPDDVTYPLGGITPDGLLRTFSLGYRTDAIGRVDLTHKYLEKLAAIVGGKVRHTARPQEWYVVKEGTDLPEAIELLSQSSEWLEAIRSYTGELGSAIETRSA